jgi:murein L,D-transpeptidase YafK
MRLARRRFLLGTAGALAAGSASLRQAEAALAPLPRPGPRADRILVLKRQRRLRLLVGEEVLHEFRVALGREPRGPKLSQGDFRTPEGLYSVDGFNPHSYYYRALRVSYPSPEDVTRARRLGVRPGGDIMIHGLDPAIAEKWREDHWLFNWTRGCIAVTNAEMDIIWQHARLGTPVEIRP